MPDDLGLLVEKPIQTTDGEELGRFREVRNGYFRVDVSWRPDYWLPLNCVEDASGDVVLLRCRKDDVDVLRRDDPPTMTEVAVQAAASREAQEVRR